MLKSLRFPKLLLIFLSFLLILSWSGWAGATKEAKKVSIRGTVWIGQMELDALKTMTAEYQKTHPNLEVEWINIVEGGPYGRDKLQTMIAGGDAPDIMMLNTGQFEGFASRGALHPLDGFAAADKFDFSPYWPASIEGSKYGGKLYGLPRDISNNVVFYNKDMFDKAGVSYPTDDWTWVEFLDASKKLTRDTNGDGKIDQWAIGIQNQVWAWAGFVWANGGEILSPDRKQCLLDSPKSVEGLRFYYELLTKYKVAPAPGDLPQQGWSGAQFQAQSVAMGIFGQWWRPALVEMKAEDQFRWDVALQPKSPNTGNRGSVLYTDQWGMSATTKQPDVVWDFMKFLTGKAGQKLLLDLIGSRAMSPIRELADTDEWLHYGGSTGEKWIETIKFSHLPPVNFGNANEAENIWDQELGLVIAGQETVEQAAKNIRQKISPILAENP